MLRTCRLMRGGAAHGAWVYGVLLFGLVVGAGAAQAGDRASNGASDGAGDGAGERAGESLDDERGATATGRFYTLDALIERAYTNEEVLQAVALRGSAEGLLAEADAQWFPQGSVTGVVGPSPEARGGPTRAAPERPGAAINFGTVGVLVRLDATVIQPLYTFGKIEGAREAGAQAVDAAGHNVDRVKSAVRALTRKAYFGVLLGRKVVALLRDAEAEVVSAGEKVAEMIDEGSDQVSESDANRITYYRYSVANQLVEARRNLAYAENGLRFLARLSPDDALTIEEVALVDAAPELPSLGEANGEARRKRPDLLALRSQARARRAFWDSTKAAYWPDLFLGAFVSYGYSSVADDQANPFVFDPYNYLSGGLGVGLRFTLDIAVKRAKALQAEAEWRKAEVQYEMLDRGLEIDVRARHGELAFQLERLKNEQKSQQAAKRWLIGEQMQYEVGVGETRNLIEGLTAWFTAQIAVQRAAYEAIAAGADLEQAMGR